MPADRMCAARQILRDASLELARLRRVRGASHETWRRIARTRKRLALAAALVAAAQAAEPAAAVVPVFRHGFVFPDSVSGDSYLVPTLADIDGDGDLDAFVSGESGSTHFFANTDSAVHSTFVVPVSNPFGIIDVGSRSFTSFGDIDGDGDLDAFIGDSNGNVSFFRNTGSAAAPAFATRVVNPFGLADVGGSAAPTPADLDGDGDLDLAVGNYSGDVVLFTNTGTVTAPAFAPPLTNPFGLTDNGIVARPAFADLDADGDLDAFIGWHLFQADRLFWFENTGSATSPSFAPPIGHPFGLVQVGSPTSVAFADVDADEDLDALVSGGPSFMLALENTGTASAPAFSFASNPFDLALPGGLTSSGREATLALADVDADGDLDSLLGGRIASSLAFSRNTGSASMASFARDPANPWALTGSEPTLADIDADGDADAFVGTSAGDVLFHENTGGAAAAAFAAPLTNPFGLTTVNLQASPAFADIDGDGDLDAFVGHGLGDTVFFENTGSAAAPAFAAGSPNPFGLAPVGFKASPGFGDLDGDGDLDGFFGHADGNFLLFENTGTANAPAFAAPVTNPTNLYDFGAWSSPELVDLEGDGDLDLVAGRASGGTRLFVNVGTPAAPFFHGGYARFSSDGTNTAPALYDLDGDGDLDALVGRSDPNLLLFRNVGTPSTDSFVAADALNPFGLREGSPRLADIDADGDLDVFLGLQDGRIRFHANVGTPSDASFAFAVLDPFGLADVGGVAVPALGDADGDGDLDAAIGNSAGLTLWFTNTGSAAAPAFASPTTNPFGLSDVGDTAAPTLADADGDGDLDAFVGNSLGDTRFFANTGSANAPAFAAPVLNPFGLARGAREAVPVFADIDDDGDLDGFVGSRGGRVFFFENVVVDADACADGLDNDGDARIDSGDAGCASAADTSELSIRQCDNGQDDDGDGRIDHRLDASGDPHCTGLLDDREAPDPAGGGCGLGPELLLLAPLLEASLRRRRSHAARPWPSPMPKPTSRS